MKTIAVVPARHKSRGIPGKNQRRLGDKTLIEHAIACGLNAGCDEVWVNCTMPLYHEHLIPTGVRHWPRPLALDQDETPMFAVIDEMRRGGCFESDGDVILILQPTQPFRTPEHVRHAIALLTETGADSVVSVVPLPLTHSPTFQCLVDTRVHPCGDLYLRPYDDESWNDVPTRRQAATQTYKRDGTIYAFRRATVARYKNLFGSYCAPLILDPSETCELDTEADWAAVERRWKERHG